MRKKGLSLFEILVATMLLAIVLLSVANIFVSVLRSVQHDHCVAVASEWIKFFLEPLHMEVNQDMVFPVPLNCLNNNSGCFSGTVTSNNIPYTVLVVTSTPVGELRKANVTINWTEGI